MPSVGMATLMYCYIMNLFIAILVVRLEEHKRHPLSAAVWVISVHQPSGSPHAVPAHGIHHPVAARVLLAHARGPGVGPSTSPALAVTSCLGSAKAPL